MADESQNFTNLANHTARANINYDGADTFYLMLLDNGAKPTESELDTWVDRADVDTAVREVTGTGYTAGGVEITPTIGSLDTANNRIPITFDPLAPGWTGSTISSIGGIVYKYTGVAANDLLVAFVDFDATVSSTDGDFNVTFLTPVYVNV